MAPFMLANVQQTVYRPCKTLLGPNSFDMNPSIFQKHPRDCSHHDGARITKVCQLSQKWRKEEHLCIAQVFDGNGGLCGLRGVRGEVPRIRRQVPPRAGAGGGTGGALGGRPSHKGRAKRQGILKDRRDIIQLLNQTTYLYFKFQIVHDFRAEAGVLRNSYDIKLAGLFDTQV